MQFKPFSGKGVKLGGAGPAQASSMLGYSPIENSAESAAILQNPRGRSTPETRAAQEQQRATRNLANESKLVKDRAKPSDADGQSND